MLTDKIYIRSTEIDYSRLVGREIKIRSEQFSGRILNAKVVAISDSNLIIDRSGSGGLVDQLITNQPVEISFNYKGEPVVFNSRISVPRVGRLQVPIAPDVTPQIKREFVRLEIPCDIRLAFCDETGIGVLQLSKLRWVKTNAINIGGGGILTEVPLFFSKDDYMILHLELEEMIVPQLMVGRIRHKQKGERNESHVGVEFIVREQCTERLPNTLLKNLPLKLFDFDEKMRSDLSAFLISKSGNNLK